MLTLTVHVTGLDNAEAKLTKLGTSLMDFTVALTSLATKLIAFYQDTVFNSSGAALGDTWVPLRPATEAYKNRHWPGRGILVRTGEMQLDFYDDVTPVSLFISNRAPYFPFQQLGTSSGPGRGHNIPARKMLGINSTVEEMAKLEIEADVRSKIDAVG